MIPAIAHIKEQIANKKLDTRTIEGRAWLVNKTASLNLTAANLFADRTALKNRNIIGRMYYFYYNAKLKETLPYWDRFPLIIPLRHYPDGFLGINLHYIYPKDRLLLLTKLQPLQTGSVNDERTRLRLSYPILQAYHRAYEATPCIKRYLWTQVRTRFLEIPAPEWDIAAALPVQDFRQNVKRTPSKNVWVESKQKYHPSHTKVVGRPHKND